MKIVKMLLRVFRAALRKRGVERSEILEMVKEIYFRRIYNPKGFEINENDVVLDIGANVGVFTLFAAAKTKNKVLAYEPLTETFNSLRLNAKSLKQVRCFCAAVSGSVGRKKLYLDGDYKVGILFDRNIHGKLKKFVTVPTTTLKKIFDENKLKKIDFLKMDVEGSEGDIIRSTPISYLKKINKISMEFHDNVSLLKHGEIIKYLKSAGFVVKLNWKRESFFGYIYGSREVL
jgi:FkbM family methyltransferase